VNYNMNTTSPNIKRLLDSNGNSIYHHAIRIGPNAMVVMLDESIVKKLCIDEQDTWFEQIPTSRGIFLAISSKKIESSHDLIESPTVDKQK
jgi:hypothetical protein